MKDNLVNESGRLVNDCISRQAAIKDAESWGAVDEYEKHLQKNVVEWLKEFPAAELGTNLAEVGTDCISRQAAISIVKFECGEWEGLAQTIVNGIKKLPSAQPKNNCSEIPNNSDLISRQDAIDALERIFDRCEEIEAHLPEGDPDRVGYKMYPDWLKVWKYLRQVPSAQPERKTGHWILSDVQSEEELRNNNYLYYCSECGKGDVHSKSVKVPFCWHCGAKMLKDGEE